MQKPLYKLLYIIRSDIMERDREREYQEERNWYDRYR